MYIKRIELENIKRYENLDIQCLDGLNFIMGRNGAGKTTIIESIGYALFDYQATIKNFAVYFVRKGQKKGSVRITFLDKNDNELIVDRKISISNAGNSWSIRKNEDGDEIAIVSGESEVKAYLKDCLEFYPDDDITEIYKNIVSVPQGEFTQAFFMTEKNRKDVFDPIFKLDTYRNAYDNIKLAKGIDEEINLFKQEIAECMGELKEYDNSEAELKAKKEEHKKNQAELADLSKNAKAYKEEFEKIQKLKDDIEKFENVLKVKKVEKEKFESLTNIAKKQYEEAKNARAILEVTKEDYQKYRQNEILIEEKEKEAKTLKAVMDEIEKLKQRVANGSTKIEEREKNLSKQLSKINEMLVRKKELQSKHEKLMKELINDSNDEESNKTDEKEKLTKMIEDNRNVIDLSYEIENLKKQILLSLKGASNVNKDIMYLNKAKSEIKIAKEGLEDIKARHLDVATESIDKAISVKRDDDTQSSMSSEDIVREKEEKESILIGIYNSYVKEKIDSAHDTKKIRESFASMLEALQSSSSQKSELELKAKLEARHILDMQNETEKEIENARKVHKQETDEMETWRKAVKTFSDQITDKKDDSEKFEKIQLEVENLKVAQKTLKLAYERYTLEQKKAAEIEKYANLIKENDEKVKLIDQETSKIIQDKEKLASMFTTDEYEQKKLQYEASNKNVDIIIEKIKIEEQNILRLGEKIKYFNELKKKVVKIKQDIVELDKVQEILSKVRNVIKNAPIDIADMLIESISKRASEIYAEIATDSSRLEWEKSYELSIYDYIDGTEIKKEFKQLSGGEQMSAALAVRLAMLELLTKLQIGILDEPTTNMDVLRREHLAEIIAMSSEKFRQLFIVSHDDTFENITQNVISLNNK